MRCAIMQPTYLPWLGYFNMIAEVDVFIFLDDVQFAKRTWQQRNRILRAGKESYITVPVFSSGKRDQEIKDVKTIDPREWQKNHRDNLKHAYNKHPYFQDIQFVLDELLNDEKDLLCEINIHLIQKIMEELNINTKIIRSSEIPVTGKKSEYLLNICEYLNVDSYLSARGSKEYIEKEGIFANSNINIEYHDFVPQHYNQYASDEYISHLSIIDVIANIGKQDTEKYLMR